MRKKAMLLPLVAVVAILVIATYRQKTASSEASIASISETAVTAGNKTRAVAESGAAARNSATAKTTYPPTLRIYDAEGKEIRMGYAHTPERVFSTQLPMTGFPIKLGSKNRIVAVSDNDDALKDDITTEIAPLKSLGDKRSVSKESILTLEPDLALGKGPLVLIDAIISTTQSYQELGIPIYTEPASASIDQSLRSIPKDVRNIGKVFDMQGKADAYMAELDKRIDTLLTKVSNQTGGLKKMLFVAGYTNDTFVGFNLKMSSRALKTLDTEDVLEKDGNGLMLENLISTNPDVTVYVRLGRFTMADVDAVTSLSEDQVIRDVPAIKSKKIIGMDCDSVMGYGAHVIDSVEKFYSFMYGK